MSQYEHCTVWHHSCCCPLIPHSYLHFQRLKFITLKCYALLYDALSLHVEYFFFYCSLSRRTQLFLKLEDFFWREHLSTLALPYGIKGSGMLNLHYCLFFLPSLMEHIVILLRKLVQICPKNITNAE